MSLGRSRLPLVRVEGSAVFLGGVYPVESDSLRYSGQFEVGEKNRSVALSCHGPNLLLEMVWSSCEENWGLTLA